MAWMKGQRVDHFVLDFCERPNGKGYDIAVR